MRGGRYPPTVLRRAIDLVEAAYRLADDEGAWLSAVLAAAEPTLANGLGCFATIYRRDAPTPAEMVSPYAVRGADTRLTDALREAFERTDDATRRLAFTIGRPVATLTDLHGVPPADNAAYRGLCRVIGFGDVLTVNAHNPDGTGCFLSAPLRASRRARASAWWSRLAAHVAAGLRLQLGLREEAVDAAEAVLTPGGTIVHATSTGALARRAIQQAARRAERARGALDLGE